MAGRGVGVNHWVRWLPRALQLCLSGWLGQIGQGIFSFSLQKLRVEREPTAKTPPQAREGNQPKVHKTVQQTHWPTGATSKPLYRWPQGHTFN